jgi:hypothetical protein
VLLAAVVGLRAALVGLPATSPSTNDPHPPHDPKRAQLLAMLDRRILISSSFT